MKIRNLKPGEDEKWSRCTGETGEPFTLKSDFQPEKYIVAEDYGRFIACLEILYEKPLYKILFNPILRTKIRPKYVLKRLINYGLKLSDKSGNYKIIILIHSDNPNLSFLQKVIPEIGFKLGMVKELYRLSEIRRILRPKRLSSIRFRTLKEVGEEEFLKLYKKIYIPEGELDRLSPEDDFAELKIFARNTGVYRPEDWFIAYYKRRPIGFTLPQCHDRKNRSGSNFYVGVIPEMRNKGFGKALQYFAVQKLKERGIKTIVGSTVPANRPMKRIFKSLGYRLELIQYFYIPAKEG